MQALDTLFDVPGVQNVRHDGLQIMENQPAGQHKVPWRRFEIDLKMVMFPASLAIQTQPLRCVKSSSKLNANQNGLPLKDIEIGMKPTPWHAAPCEGQHWTPLPLAWLPCSSAPDP